MKIFCVGLSLSEMEQGRLRPPAGRLWRFSALFTINLSFFYKDWQVTNIFCCYCQQLGVRDSIFAVQGAVYKASSILLYLHWTCLALLMEYLISCSLLSDNCFSCLISCCSIQNTETEKLFSPCYKTSLICHICHAVSKLIAQEFNSP